MSWLILIVGIAIGFLWGYLRRPDNVAFRDMSKAHDQDWVQREAVLALCREPHDAGDAHLISAEAVIAIYGVTP